MCVGGSTVVNNAVCFDLPDDVAERWMRPVLESGLERDRLADAFAHVRRVPERRAGSARRAAQSRRRASRRGAGRARRGSTWPTPTSSAAWARATATSAAASAAALGARLDAAQGAAPGDRRGARAPRVPCRARPDARRPGRRRAGTPRGRTPHHGAGEDGRAQRGRARVQRHPAAQRPRRGTSGAIAVVQHRLPGDAGLRGRAALGARPPDLALPRADAARAPGRRGGDLVQPDRLAVAVHAGLVRRALAQHAPLRRT